MEINPIISDMLWHFVYKIRSSILWHYLLIWKLFASSQGAVFHKTVTWCPPENLKLSVITYLYFYLQIYNVIKLQEIISQSDSTHEEIINFYNREYTWIEAESLFTVRLVNRILECRNIWTLMNNIIRLIELLYFSDHPSTKR